MLGWAINAVEFSVGKQLGTRMPVCHKCRQLNDLLNVLVQVKLGLGGGLGARGGAPGNQVSCELVRELTVCCFSLRRNLQILLEFRFWKPVQRTPQM